LAADGFKIVINNPRKGMGFGTKSYGFRDKKVKKLWPAG